MSTTRDWLPTVRTQFTMAKNWSQIIGNSAIIWTIPIPAVFFFICGVIFICVYPQFPPPQST